MIVPWWPPPTTTASKSRSGIILSAGKRPAVVESSDNNATGPVRRHGTPDPEHRGVLADERAARRQVLPKPLRGRASGRLRGLRRDVSVLHALQRGAAGGGRGALLVLRRDALPGAQVPLRHRHRRLALHVPGADQLT